MRDGKVCMVALAAVCAAACGGGPKAPQASQPAPTSAVSDVATAAPDRRPLAATIDVPGTLLPDEESTIAAPAPGTVTRIGVESGTRVGAGALLVQIDADKAELAVRQAEAGLEQARANFAKAKGDLERKQVLLDDRTIAAGTFESFKAQHDAAAAAVAMADATLALARRRLRELTVTAPFAGIVKERKIAPGEYVREGDALVVVIRVHPLKLQFELPEKHAGRLVLGQEISATVTSLPGAVFPGRVATVFPALDQATRTLRAEAAVANADYRLRPGFYASVRVPLAAVPSAVVVPRAAIVSRDGTDHVFVLDGDRVRLVRVTIGIQDGDSLEVLTGLSPSDAIVIDGAATLTDGERVRVRS